VQKYVIDKDKGKEDLLFDFYTSSFDSTNYCQLIEFYFTNYYCKLQNHVLFEMQPLLAKTEALFERSTTPE